MKTSYGKKFSAGLLVLALALALPAMAQMGGGMMDGKKGDGPGMQQMSGMMHDLADHMVGMSGDMSMGKLSAAQQKQMSGHMREMATMMDQMSGMMGKGMMMDAEMQKQMHDMRGRMDDMMKSGSTTKK